MTVKIVLIHIWRINNKRWSQGLIRIILSSENSSEEVEIYISFKFQENSSSESDSDNWGCCSDLGPCVCQIKILIWYLQKKNQW